MQTNTTGLSMETIFDIMNFALLCSCLVGVISMSKKVNTIDSRFEPLYRKNEQIIEALYGDIEVIEKAIVGLSEKVEALPDMFKDDIHRSLLALRDTLETTKPIRPNNWDSMKEAFKGPTRIEINERN